MSFSGTKGHLTKPKPGVMLNPLHPLSRGLVGYWLFNEGAGSRALDISGSGNHGMLKNMSSNAQGSGWGGSKFGGNLKFDGTDDYVNCGNSEILNFERTDAFSISVWFRSSSQTGQDMLVGRGKATAPYNGWTFHIDDTVSPTVSKVRIYFINTYPTSTIEVVGSTVLDDGVWHHVVMTYSGSSSASGINVYIDGINENLTVIQDTLTTTIKNTYNVNIGSLNDTNYFHDGSIGPVLIYKRELLPREAKTLYHNPFCNLLQVPIQRYSVIAPVGAIMNQFQRANIGADLYNGAIIA